jgi:ABC-2 type transport system permease protein
MKKYYFVFRTSLQRFVEYRSEIYIDVVGKIGVPIVVQYLLWSAVIASMPNRQIGNYAFGDMMRYLIFSTVIYNFMQVNFVERQIARGIREGELNKFLTKPLDFMLYNFMVFLADSAIIFVASVVVLIGCMIAGLVTVEPLMLLFGIISILSAMLLNYILAFMICLLAFWMEEIWTLFVMKNMSLWFLTGQVIPLDLFPERLQVVMKYLPFGYLAFFPAKIFTGKLTLNEIAFGFGVQTVWLFVFYAAYRMLWRVALKRYEAFGG